MSDLPLTGVQLIAKDADTFKAQMTDAQSTVDSFGKTASDVASGTLKALGSAAGAGAGLVGNLGSTLQSTTGILGGFGSIGTNVVNALGGVFDTVFNQIIRTGVRQAIRDVEEFISTTASAAIQGTQLETDIGRAKASLDAISKVSFAPLVGQLSNLVEQAAPSFLGVVQAGESYLGGLGSSALVWGENVVNQFAQGIIDAAGAVLDALTTIANLVTEYLAPGSPPKILPDIDKWGTAAANEFFGGWAKADFSVFDDLSSTVGALIQSIPLPKADQVGVIPAILGSREGIAQAVEELRSTGAIAAATLDRIVAGVGTASASVRDYLTATIRLQAANADVTAAQNELNKVTATYNDLLKPVDAQIDSITEAQQQLADSQKKSLLQLVLADPNASAAQKRNAQLEIEKIDAQARQRALVAEQKTAVDAAQTKLDAAKAVQSKAEDELAAKQALIKAETDQNNLLKQQLALLESLNKATAAGGGPKPKTGGGGLAAPKPFGVKKFDLGDLFPPDLLKKWGDFTSSLGKVWDSIAAKFQPTIDAINSKLVPAFQGLITAITDRLPTIQTEIAKTFAFMIDQSALAGPTMVTNIATALDSIADIVRNHGDTIIHAVGFVFRAGFTAAVVALNDLVGLATVALVDLATVLDVGSLVLQGKWSAAWDRLLEGNKHFWDVTLATADTAWTLFFNLFGLKWADIKTDLQAKWDAISSGAGQWLQSLHAYIVFEFNGIKTALATTWENIKTNVQARADEIKNGLSTTLTNLKTNWDSAWDGVHTKLTETWDAITGKVQGAIDGAYNAITTRMDQLDPTWRQEWESVKTALEEKWDAMVTGVETKISSVQTTINTTVDTIKTDWQQKWDAIKTKLETNWDGMKTKVNSTITSTQTDLATTLGQIKSKWDEIWGGVKTTIDTKWDEIKGKVNSAIEDIKTAISGQVDNFKSIGGNLINAIKNGINDAIAGLVDAAAHAALAALDAAKAALGISSPSKLFAEVGTNIMAGMTQGIQTETAATLQAMSDSVSQLVGGATGGGSVSAPARGGQGASSSYNYASSTGPTFVYSPSYNSAPASVRDNFATMQAMWG